MGTLTITTTAAQDARISKAFGAELEIPDGTANAAQFRNAILAYIKQVVRRHEIKAATIAANQAIQGVTDIDVT